MEPLVSIVIPCYNAELYIEETLISILSQSGVDFEVIIIDDGSIDKTAIKIKGFEDKRIKYFYQKNFGVSTARNNGFDKVKGEFVIFFDADDIMPENFVFSRVEKIKSNVDISFLCGEVLKFEKKEFFTQKFKGPDNINLEAQILLYDQCIITCPSNFIFRVNFLRKHNISFESQLNSTADRYYLLQCKRLGKMNFFEDIIPLYYRVTANSMSNKMTYNLVRDNETYYNLLKDNSLIPKEIRNISLFLGDYILFGSYWKIGIRAKAVKFAMSCFFRNPVRFLNKFLNKKIGD